jgi:hypothetical protein
VFEEYWAKNEDKYGEKLSWNKAFYGSETWTIVKADQTEIYASETRC